MIEAVVLAATEPVEPRFLARARRAPGLAASSGCATSSRPSTSRRGGASCSPGRRRLPLPDPPRPAPRTSSSSSLEGQHVRLSGPALETLAIVAYKQPISRGQISAIRGVNVESTLADARAAWLRRRGRSRPGPGARGAVRHHVAASSSGSGSTPSPTCRHSATSCPDPSVVEALERGLRMPDDPSAGPRRPASTTTTTASPTRVETGAGIDGRARARRRRSSRAPVSGRGARARS